jgi:hypothetical protein
VDLFVVSFPDAVVEQQRSVKKRSPSTGYQTFDGSHPTIPKEVGKKPVSAPALL